MQLPRFCVDKSVVISAEATQSFNPALSKAVTSSRISCPTLSHLAPCLSMSVWNKSFTLSPIFEWIFRKNLLRSATYVGLKN